MKSKKLLVFLIVLVFIAVLIVINSTLFTLQNISVTWLTNTINLKSVSDSDIVAQIEKGDSIFLLDKSQISAKLEKKYPYLRVVGIETKFPNKIVVYSAEREDLYAVKLADDEYAILDDFGKVLGISNSSVFDGKEIDAKPIAVNFGGLQLKSSDFVVGEQVKIANIESILVQLSYTLKEANYSTLAKKGVFKSIDILPMGDGGEIGIHFKTRNGMYINILDAKDCMTDKFMLGIEVYNKYHQDSYKEGTISVLYSLEEEDIVAYFDDKKIELAVV